MTIKKAWVGVVTLLALHLGLGGLAGAAHAETHIHESILAAVLWLIPAAAVSWSMRRIFVGPALLVWAAMWALALVALSHQPAAPAVAAIVREHAPSLSASFVAVVLGASLGRLRSASTKLAT